MSVGNSPEVFRVYSVEQADRITLISSNQFPPKLKTIILSCISAPKVAHMNHNQELVADEPFAYQAREYVRRSIIGKRVVFIHDDKIEALHRESGRLLLNEHEDIGVSLACKGMCTVVHKKGLGKYQELLLEAQTQAKKQEHGIFSPDASTYVRNVQAHPPADAAALFSLHKEKQIRVLVERVLSGSSILCMILESNQLIVVHFSGIFVPPLKDSAPDSIAHKAKFHTEVNLLHRTVTLVLEDVLQQKQFLGSVVSGKNVFSEELLSHGYAKISNSLNKTSFGEKLIAAEKKAQRECLGVWDDVALAGIDRERSVSQSDTKKEFDALIIQVISGDTVILLRDCKTTKVTIANVRASRSYKKVMHGDGMESEIVYDYYTWEGREFLRKLVIGKTVRVKVDYTRSNTGPDGEVHVYATIKLKEDGQNVGAMLVSMGLASARVSLRNNAENVDLLRACEQKARKAKIGLHNPGAILEDHSVLELSKLSDKRAKHFLGLLRGKSLTGGTRLSAYVESVLSPTHFKLYVEKIKAFMNFKIAGIVTHQETHDKDAGIATDDAFMFALCNIQGHDVDIEVQGIDKYGNFVGSIFLYDENYAVILMQNGLAKLSEMFKGKYEDLVREAEKLSMKSRNLVPQIAAQSGNAGGEESCMGLVPSSDIFPVMLTEIESAHLFYVCTLDSQTLTKRDMVEQKLELYEEDHRLYNSVKANEIVLARYSLDSRWYRAIVKKICLDECDVRFIDYGNGERRTAVDLRKMVDDALLQETPALACEGRLAFIQCIPEQFEQEAEFLFREYCSVPSLFARTEYILNGTRYFSIFSEPGKESASEYLLREGFAILDHDLYELKCASLRKRLQDHSAIEKAARADGNGIWQYRSPSAMSF
ncbi:hypothetical protein XU18_3689 [Perkinsela sp. CCAP 1560/4]|nr:hypothetical protein XU18_3689 [Perkinsela sp. CCAP 1560/4]|eukprot:KNH05285.1 hypothetical protein XU18_3689 [Perkinsela sp. CCAP 1560/4]